MNANAIIKSFLFMMCTSTRKRAKSKGQSAKIPWLLALSASPSLFRCQCRGGRVLTIELSDEGFGDIQRFGGADDALNFGDIEDQRDAMALGIDIESLADVLIDWAQDLLELLIKGSLSIFAFTLIVFLHLLDLIVLLRSDLRILERCSFIQIGRRLLNLLLQGLQLSPARLILGIDFLDSRHKAINTLLLISELGTINERDLGVGYTAGLGWSRRGRRRIGARLSERGPGTDRREKSDRGYRTKYLHNFLVNSLV